MWAPAAREGLGGGQQKGVYARLHGLWAAPTKSGAQPDWSVRRSSAPKGASYVGYIAPAIFSTLRCSAVS